MKCKSFNWRILMLLLLGLLIAGTDAFAQISPSDFVTTWKTNNVGITGTNQIFIPAFGEYKVYYESIPAGTSAILPAAGTFIDNQTITFPAAGTYRVAIKPTGATPFHQILNQSITDQNKLLTIEQWGAVAWSSMEFAYYHCEALTSLPETDLPLLNNVTSMEFAFTYCTSLTGSSNMNSWDVGHVTNMHAMFGSAKVFNMPIVDWDVSNVTTMTEMFLDAAVFNQPIGGWKVGNVASMANMFDRATRFNQPLGNWNVSRLQSADDMFHSAISFNQPLKSWDVSSVSNMSDMFRDATAFNQPINNWNVSNVVRVDGMFMNATAFNQTLSNWTFNADVGMRNMLAQSGMDCGNYNTTLIGWASNPATPEELIIGVSGLTYGPPAADAHDDLVNNKGWGFSGDGFSASCTSLPVTLVSFDAKNRETSSLLTWSTTEETNSDRFEIQRSADADSWALIGTVASNRESKTLQTYQFRDQAPLNGTNYYRLRMVDNDQTFAFSRIQIVKFTADPFLNIYPNPVSDKILVSNYEQVKQISLFNGKGLKLLENNTKLTQHGLDVSKLTPGFHILRILFKDGSSQTTNLMIAR